MKPSDARRHNAGVGRETRATFMMPPVATHTWRRAKTRTKYPPKRDTRGSGLPCLHGHTAQATENGLPPPQREGSEVVGCTCPPPQNDGGVQNGQQPPQRLPHTIQAVAGSSGRA